MKLAGLAVAFALLAGPAFAEDAKPAPPPCSGPEFRQMDFWLGEWDVSWEGGSGHNSITKAMGECVIAEHFTMPEFEGKSVSLFHQRTGVWRQTWVDVQGDYFDLTGGPEGKDFVLNTVRVNEKEPRRRMVFADIEANSLTWRWQGSDDGTAWKDLWVIKYVRQTARQ